MVLSPHKTRLVRWVKDSSVTRILILVTLLGWLIVSLVDFSLSYFFSSFPRFSLLRTLWIDGDFGLFMREPWRLISYLFVHSSLLHLVVNLVLLGYFGRYVESLLGKRQFLILYLLGGVVSALFYPLSFFLFRLIGIRFLALPLLGASGAIFAVVMGLGVYSPRLSIPIGGYSIPAIYLVLIVLVLGLIVSLMDSLGGFSVHMGGILFGLIYVLWIRKMNHKKKILSEISQTSKGDWEAIVEKIKHSGYTCLNEQEKQILFKKSTSLRKRDIEK